MSSLPQRGPRVFYVAGAVRDFPPDVQEWLAATTHRPASCPDLYDLLAVLARGHRPAAVVFCLEAVDWNELEAFDHVAHLSPTTRMYVAGQPHQDKKLEAACARGAMVFDADAIEEDLGYRLGRTVGDGPMGLLAGSLRTEDPPPRIQPEASPAKPAIVEEPERPSVRLVPASEEEHDESPAESSAVPVPWAPSPDRPKRTPPPSRKPPLAAAGTSEADAAASAARLTPEEMAALLGDGSGGASRQERHGG